ncbi:hypothetical protein AAUPMB_16000, partial [Pasteurella multocida subsp. multocida str. Anand1_buffalo]
DSCNQFVSATALGVLGYSELGMVFLGAGFFLG